MKDEMVTLTSSLLKPRNVLTWCKRNIMSLGSVQVQRVVLWLPSRSVVTEVQVEVCTSAMSATVDREP